MAKKGIYEELSDKVIAKLQREIRKLYYAAADEVGVVANVNANTVANDKAFKLTDYPIINRMVGGIISKLVNSVSVAIISGIKEQWRIANDKNDNLCKVVFGDTLEKLTKERKRAYFTNNDKALKTFIERKEGGMNLSQRVWKYGSQFKGQIEKTIELGIKEGSSADQIARNLKQYLNYPDKLFRRVRDEQGRLHLSKSAKAFHPGQGVYRSSYKNALRLAATENNIAYAQADYLRYQKLDFVVGIEIHLSNNHTLNGEPFYDICDVLAGKYPKSFRFTGWHPLCRCFVTSILKTEDETFRDLDGVDRGSVNAVTKMPAQFRAWVRSNADRIQAAEGRGTLPYFLRDNEWAWRGKNRKGLTKPKLSAKEVAEIRHKNRTAEDIRRIQDLADLHTYGQEYVDNVHRIEIVLGMKRGKRMTHEEANTGKVNPNYGKLSGFDMNCSTCCATYILRRMGFDVEANGRTSANNALIDKLGMGVNAWDKWIGGIKNYHSIGWWMRLKGYTQMSTGRYKEFFDYYTKEPGVYEANVGWKGGAGGHATLLVRKENGELIRIEQQRINPRDTFETMLNSLTTKPATNTRGIMRVDNALFNPYYAEIVSKASK